MSERKGRRNINMNELKYIWKIYFSMWFSTALAISIAIYFTHSAWCLWALIFPGMHTWKSNVNNTGDV